MSLHCRLSLFMDEDAQLPLFAHTPAIRSLANARRRRRRSSHQIGSSARLLLHCMCARPSRPCSKIAHACSCSGAKQAIRTCRRGEQARQREPRAKSRVSHQPRFFHRYNSRSPRHNRRFYNPSLRLVESFGSALAVAATLKEKFWNVQSLGRQNTFLLRRIEVRVEQRISLE